MQEVGADARSRRWPRGQPGNGACAQPAACGRGTQPRDASLKAAADVFAESGTDGSLEEIARRAGRRASARCTATSPPVARSSSRSTGRVCRAVRAPPRCCSRSSPAEQAIEEWVLGFADYAGRKRGHRCRPARRAGRRAPRPSSPTRSAALRRGPLLFDAARDAGAIRGDVHPLDVLRTVSRGLHRSARRCRTPKPPSGCCASCWTACASARVPDPPNPLADASSRRAGRACDGRAASG